MKQYNSYEEYKKEETAWHLDFINKAKKELGTDFIKDKTGKELTLEKSIQNGYNQYLSLKKRLVS